ncbi:MAG: DUF6880 family protein [Actinomycetota bacterium]
MSRKARQAADPLEREIEAALEPGRFVSDRACFSFVGDIEEVENEVAKLIQTAPARAVALYEAFLAGCYEKANEIDDSSGSFGMFVTGLFCGWIKARQAADAAPDETATRLLAWMDDDPFGFCYTLEKDAAKVLDKAGLAALTNQVRARFEAAKQTAQVPDERLQSKQSYLSRRWADALRTLFFVQRDVEAYVALAEETGLTAHDCHAVAAMLVAHRKPDQALSWVERGIELETKTPHGSWAGHSLAELKPHLLKKLGREDEALEAAWAEYREHPSRYSYDDLMKFVPKTERLAWHEKAIEAAMGTDLHSLIELLLHTKEMERLAELVHRSTDDVLEAVSHYATEGAAKKLEKTHAGAAARLWRAQGMRILKEKKSKHYDAALRNLERARRCYEKAGIAVDWQQVVSEVRAEHHRKTRFMPGFEEIVRGSGPSQEPPFLERAKARWAPPYREDRPAQGR